MSEPGHRSGSGRGAPPVITRWLGRLAGLGPPLPSERRFVLAGIDWHGPADARIELRARRAAGGWTPWVGAATLGHDSNRGEAPALALVGEPIWTGLADAVQLRSAAAVEGVSLHLVPADAVAWAAGEQSVAQPAGDAAATAAQGFQLAMPELPAGPGQPPIIARHAWAGRLLPRIAPSYGQVRMAFVHHSVNANAYSVAEVPAMLRSIYLFHTRVRGWNDIGYNFAVDAYGRVWEARAGGIDRPVIGAQAGGYNAESTGAVLLGDFAATLPTSAARSALAHLVAWKLALHGVPVSGRVTVEVDPSDASYTRFRPGQRVSLPRIAGHRDGCTTDCPGSDMYLRGMPALRRSVAALAGRQHALTLAPGPPPGRAYALAPYPIARGTRVRRATYLQLASVTIVAGRELPLHGFLRSLSGTPRRDAPILLQDLSSSSRADPETMLTHTRTGAGGLWTHLLAPQSNLLLRALHTQAPATVSSLLVVAVRPQLTLGAIGTDGGAQLSGTVFPAKRHILLEIAAVGAPRHLVKRTTVAADAGFFETAIRLGRGRYRFTAHTQADALNLAGESPEVILDL